MISRRTKALKTFMKSALLKKSLQPAEAPRTKTFFYVKFLCWLLLTGDVPYGVSKAIFSKTFNAAYEIKTFKYLIYDLLIIVRIIQ